MKNNMKMISFAYHEIIVHKWRRRFIRVLTALVVAVVIIVALAIGLINHGYCGNAEEEAPTPICEELPTAATDGENAHPITFIRSAKSYEGYKRFIL